MLDAYLDRLAAFEPSRFPVLSLYLDTSRDETGRTRFDQWLRQEFDRRADTYAASSPERESFDRDVTRIHEYVANELRPDAKGLVIVSCSGADLFEAVQLDVSPGSSVLVVNDRPHLYPLARLDDQYPRYAALLADTNRARLFVFSTGRCEQVIDMAGQKTKRVKVGGWSQARYQRHIENYHLQHVKEVVDVLDRVVREERIPHVILAGDEVVIPLLRAQLPKHLEEKIVEVVRLDQRTPEHEVLDRTLDALRRKDAETDEAVVQELLDEYRGGGLAAVGAVETMAAFERGQVDELVIAATSDAIEEARVVAGGTAKAHAGSADVGLAAVDAAAERAERPEGELAANDQVAGELVARARQTGATVRFIEDTSLLDDIGGVGAFLRFRL